MKYLKSFENKDKFITITQKNKYCRNIYFYLLYVDSIEKFNFALDKIGIKDDFYGDIWSEQNHIDIYITPKLEQKKLYLSVDYWSGTFEVFDHEPSDYELLAMRDDDEKNCKIIYGGEVHVSDLDLDLNKYNL